MRRPLLLCASLLISALTGLVGCGAEASSSAGPRTPASMGTMPQEPGNQSPPVQTKTTVISSSDAAGTAHELYERGKQLMQQEQYAEAARAFDLVQSGDPDPQLAVRALLDAGTAYESAGQPARALERYADIPRRFPSSDLVKIAAVRSGRLHIKGERWPELGAVADALLARPDLSISEHIEASGDKALSLALAGNDAEAMRFVERARTIMEKNHIGESGKIPDEAALVYFALGEARRLGSERVSLLDGSRPFGEAFEVRASGLLDAQSAYSDTMRTTNAFWATWAGYRVGQLYQKLHDDVMQVKLPDTIKEEKDRVLFEGALQLRYRVLLEKGLKMMDATVRMNDRIGESNAWTARAREARAKLEERVKAANEVIKKTGVPEETLKKSLEDLAKMQKKKS